MKKIIKLFLTALMFFSLVGCGSAPTEEVEEPKLLFDVSKVASISSEELLEVMGEQPNNKEKWTLNNKHEVTTWDYDIDGYHYEFIIESNKVIRLSIYSPNYWFGEEERIHHSSPLTKRTHYKDTYNIVMEDGKGNITAETPYVIKINPELDYLDEIWLEDLNSQDSSYGFAKFTFNKSYFE